MTTIIAILLFIIFLFLSGIHIYWALGGGWGKDAAIPTKDNNVKVMNPSVLSTLIVAFGLLGFGLVVVLNVVEVDFKPSFWLDFIYKYGLWIITGIFFLRAIGDFNYLGFFKKYKLTNFGRNDTKYFSPLCLLIGILTIIVELSK